MVLPPRAGIPRFVRSVSLLVLLLLLGQNDLHQQLGRSPGLWWLVAADAPPAGRLAESEAKLRQYLLEERPSRGTAFHVQGWRWHTMSLVREADRLQKLALRTLEEQQQQQQQMNEDTGSSTTTEHRLEALRVATDYVVGFNMKGLHKIEKDLFFPWVRETTCRAVEEEEICRAITDIMEKLESDRRKLEEVGASMNRNEVLKSAEKLSPVALQRAIRNLAREAGVIKDTASAMLMQEETFLVPAVARLVSDAEQKAFNNRVIRKLGILDSRLHLVSMHEAVQHNEAEQRLFQESIPSIPQMMIPRWKRLMYEPRVGILATVD